jgi:hypothetical protein
VSTLSRNFITAMLMSGAIILFNSLFVFWGKIPRPSSHIFLFLLDAVWALVLFGGISLLLTKLVRLSTLITDFLLSFAGALVYTILHFFPSIRFHTNIEGVYTSGLFTVIIEAFIIYLLIAFAVSIGHRLLRLMWCKLSSHLYGYQ